MKYYITEIYIYIYDKIKIKLYRIYKHSSILCTFSKP